MTRSIVAMAATVVAAGASGDVVYFANGDRLTGTLAEAAEQTLAIDVAHLGIVRAPCTLVARVESKDSAAAWCVKGDEPDAADAAETSSQDAQTHTPRSSSAAAATRSITLAQTIAEWNLQSDLGLAVASGNTRTQDLSFVVAADRTGQRFDNVIGISVRKAKARASSSDDLATTKDQLDLDYDLRWKYNSNWYAVANFEYFRDPIKDIERRVTAGLGAGVTLLQSELGSLSMDAGVSRVFQQTSTEGKFQDPALRWNLRFSRWLIEHRLEAFHNNQWLRVLAADRGSVWESDTGIRLQLNDRWQAGVRVDLQYASQPPPGRRKTDASYALVLGLKL